MPNDLTPQAPTSELAPEEILTLKPEQYVAAVYKGFKADVADLIARSQDVQDADPNTTKGMAVYVSWRASFREQRLKVEAARKERKAPILEIGKLLDSSAKEITGQIKEHEERFDKPIKAVEAKKAAEKAEREAKEKARIEAHQDRIDGFNRLVLQGTGQHSTQIQTLIEQCEAIEVTAESFEEFAGRGLIAQTEALNSLRKMLESAQASEAEAARLKAEREELDRQRAEQEAQRNQLAAQAKKIEDDRREFEESQREVTEPDTSTKADAGLDIRLEANCQFTDNDLIEAMGDVFEITPLEAIDRIAKFDVEKAREFFSAKEAA